MILTIVTGIKFFPIPPLVRVVRAWVRFSAGGHGGGGRLGDGSFRRSIPGCGTDASDGPARHP